MLLLALATRLALADAPADPAEPPVEPPPTCAPDLRWPGAAWETGRAHQPAVDALEAYAFAPTPDDPERSGVRTDGVVVIHDGRLIYERYGRGYSAEQRHLVWSVSKTFTNALIGVAVREGRLAIEDSICQHLDLAREESCAIKVVDLMEMASGLDWKETYEGEPPTASSVLAMLYGEGRQDMVGFVTGHPLRDPPGTTWMYSSGDSNVLAAVAGAALEPAHGRDFPWAVLFDPLGMTHATWERDGQGVFVGSSYVYDTPRDLARFGLLWLRDGCWAGERLLPEGWVAASTQVNDPMRQQVIGWEPGDVYGRQLWLNQAVPEIGQAQRPWPSVPEDAYAALGHWKQSITVIPSRDLVVVRVADDRDGTYDHDHFLSLAMALVEAP